MTHYPGPHTVADTEADERHHADRYHEGPDRYELAELEADNRAALQQRVRDARSAA